MGADDECRMRYAEINSNAGQKYPSEHSDCRETHVCIDRPGVGKLQPRGNMQPVKLFILLNLYQSQNIAVFQCFRSHFNNGMNTEDTDFTFAHFQLKFKQHVFLTSHDIFSLSYEVTH